MVLTYEEEGAFTREYYISYVVDDETLYAVEIKDNGELATDEDIEKFLSLTISENDDNNSFSSENSNDDESDDMFASLEQQSTVASNSVFEAYEGNQKGTQIKTLLQSVQSRNEENEENTISVKFNNSLYTDGISEIEDSIDSNSTYEVEFEYSSDGLVNKIIITEE